MPALILLTLVFLSPPIIAQDALTRCRDAEQDQVLQVTPKELAANSSAQDLADFVIKNPNRFDISLAPWPLSFSPEKKYREAALLVQIFLVSKFLQSYGVEVPSNPDLRWIRSYFESRLKQQVKYSSREIWKTRKKFYIDNMFVFNWHNPLEVGYLSLALCSHFGSNLCIGGMSTALKTLKPTVFRRGNSTVALSARKIWIDVLTTELYRDAGLKLALKVIDRIEKNESIGGGFFSDVKTSFSDDTGDTREEEIWKYLAWYSTRGASVDANKDAYNAENFDLGAAQYIISVGINLLDIGHGDDRYTLPKGFTSVCEVARPYHFWMPAYLSRMISRRWRSKTVGLTTSFVAAIGYEFGANTFGRDPASDLETPLFDHHKNLIRSNIALSAAGAMYGAYANEMNGTVSIDKFLDVLHQNARPLKEDQKREIDRYSKRLEFQLQIFAPDAAFDLIKNFKDH